jgi:hypothetical protein
MAAEHSHGPAINSLVSRFRHRPYLLRSLGTPIR